MGVESPCHHYFSPVAGVLRCHYPVGGAVHLGISFAPRDISHRHEHCVLRKRERAFLSHGA